MVTVFLLVPGEFERVFGGNNSLIDANKALRDVRIKNFQVQLNLKVGGENFPLTLQISNSKNIHPRHIERQALAAMNFLDQEKYGPELGYDHTQLKFLRRDLNK